jgi:diguanylate cyclase
MEMAIRILSDEQMREGVKVLEQAVYNHEQWAETLFGTLICRLPPDERDMSVDAHCKCRFGQWYYTAGKILLEGHPGFVEIGLEHQRMHQFAASLLRSTVDGVPISISDYERFVSTMKLLRLEITTIRRELEDSLFNLDPLTGTPSRSGMLTKLRAERELVKRNVSTCVVVMMDLDDFKGVNDKYGHGVGDKVLVSSARYVMTHLRPYDKVFRYGGEEFLICLPGADLQSGHDIIDRLREELRSLPHDANGKGTFHTTVSFGLTLLDPDLPVELSIDRADKALYVAKTTGRNRAITWDASMKGSPAKSEGSA